MHISEKLESALPILEEKWDENKNKKGKNILFATVFTAFKWSYIKILFWNILVQAMNLSNPFIIKYFTAYLQHGTNGLEGTFDFWDFSTTPNLEWLTAPKQYAIFLSTLIVVLQVLIFLIEKNVDFQQTMLGARSTGCLITMIYKK